MVNDCAGPPHRTHGGPSRPNRPWRAHGPEGVEGARLRDFSRSNHLRYLGRSAGPKGAGRPKRLQGQPIKRASESRAKPLSASLPGVLAGIFGHGDGSIHGDDGMLHALRFHTCDTHDPLDTCYH
jgi:hypothetical protein